MVCCSAQGTSRIQTTLYRSSSGSRSWLPYGLAILIVCASACCTQIQKEMNQSSAKTMYSHALCSAEPVAQYRISPKRQRGPGQLTQHSTDPIISPNCTSSGNFSLSEAPVERPSFEGVRDCLFLCFTPLNVFISTDNPILLLGFSFSLR